MKKQKTIEMQSMRLIKLCSKSILLSGSQQGDVIGHKIMC